MAKSVWFSIAAGLLQAAQPVAAGCLPPGEGGARFPSSAASIRERQWT